MEEHLNECPHCAELFRAQAALGRRLASATLSTLSVGTAQLAATEALVARERGVRAFLRSRSTRVRWALSLSLPALLLVRELSRGRVAWREFSMAKLLGGLLLAAVLALVAHSALGPMPLERRARRLRNVLALIAWCLPCMLWLAPETRASALDLSPGFALRAVTCFGYGSLFAAPGFVLLWAFDRGEQLRLRMGALAAGSVALVSNLILLLHCPSNEPVHLLTGHFSIGLVWLLAVFVAGWRLERAHST